MANFNKKPLIIVSIIIASAIMLYVITSFILSIFDDKNQIEYGKDREKIINVFSKYENSNNIVDIIDGLVIFGDYEATFSDQIYDNNQIIFTRHEVFYIYGDGLFSTTLKIYSRDVFDDSKQLLYTTVKMKNSPKFKTFDNCFYIKYDTKKEKNIVDVYDVDERRYYNYSRGEDISLDDIVYEEQKKKYKVDITISEDEKTIIIKNMETNETRIIDDELIKNSIYKEDMFMFEYKVRRAYISYGHILLVYTLVDRVSCVVVYEYLFDNNIIELAYFDERGYSSKRYEYIDPKQ